jgi:hypothetical protein
MTLRPFRLTTLLEAAKVAELRWLEARAIGMNSATTYHSDYCEIMGRDITGILGEMVVGRRFDKAYLPAINTFHGKADVGEDIEVRATEHLNGSLIVRDNDDPARRYVLVVVDPMRGFAVRGWIYGYEATKDEWHMKSEGRPHWRYKGPLRSFSTLTLERPKDAPTNAETASAEYAW